MIIDRKKLLKELMKKYSFEKSHSIIQIVNEDGFYKNKELSISGQDSALRVELIWF